MVHLIHQLLHTENITARMEISKTIFALLPQLSLSDATASTIEAQFVPRVKACALHPQSRERAVLIEWANRLERSIEGVWPMAA